MRHFLLFFTLATYAQTTPVAGIFHDGRGALRSLQGTEGAWVAPILVPSGVVSAGYSGKTLWYKTESELHVISGEEIVVPAPAGPVVAKFNETGDLSEIYFASGERARWLGRGLEFVESVDEVPSLPEDLGPGRLLIRRDGVLYAWSPGSAPVLVPLAEIPSFQLFSRADEAELPVGSAFLMPPSPVGESSTARFRIRNPTTNPITINRLSIDPSPFKTFDQFYPPALIPSGGHADFSVRFSPTEAGDVASTLWINDLQVKLQGGTVAATSVEILDDSVWKPLVSPFDLGTVERRTTLTRRLRITPDAPPTLAGTGFTLAVSDSEWLISVYSDTARTLSGTIQVANRTFNLKATFTEFPLPRPSIQPSSGTLTSGLQQKIVLQFAEPAKATVLGLLKLVFTPRSSSLGDDPAIAFLPRMERSVNFRLNEGSTVAEFGGSDFVLLQTGSTAGTIALTVDLGGLAEHASYRIDPAPIAISATKASTSHSSAEVLLTGVDNTRTTDKIAFTFFHKDGHTVLPGRQEVDVSSSFKNYFETSATGTFQLRATFSVTGDLTALGGVDVEITNSQGVTKSGRLPLN
ncbi:hypothetical protein [uncultured Paludibaculum sp.]|uniref:hypothetical protein n=1 Tax=uncultured Paludibaculum sp. TaxID=1765020 RepID=UPI002AAB3A18|nr:hypothetical protein [uncultured Paludibaculum sp.]